MRINLSPQQLSAFVQLARKANFSAAARVQGVSQPALSRMVQQMEEIVGRRLLDRTTRSVVLTPTGRELLLIAERLVAEFDSAFGELERFVEGRRGRVGVAALPSIAAVLLPPAIARYQAGCPEVEIDVLDGLSGSVLEDVAQSRAEIGLTIRPSPRATLAYRPLLSDEFGLVCRPDDELAGEGPLPWSVFESRPFVAMVRRAASDR
jgi:LysR family transcriptional regulator, carnitine catabolism transcriptional activator